MRQTLVLILLTLAACSDDKPQTQPVVDAGSDIATDTSSPQDAAGDADDATADAEADVTDAGPDLSHCERSEAAYTVPAIRVPRWAFMPWISKDISDAADTYAFVEGFKTRDIPVGVVVLDSPWETHYNTFIPNPDRYPNFETMVSDLKAQDVRVVLWVTQMVNDIGLDAEQGGDVYVGPASNFKEGLECNYYVDDGKRYTWWKGRGAGVDFFNPSARAWWHAQQDALLDMGVAGWKLDFGESYIRRDIVQTAAGEKPHQDYSEAYYQDFWEYGAARLGTENFITMVRGYDKSYDFEGRFFARREHAPIVWAGDNRRDWVGLEDALDHMFRSAAVGYVVVGSDLGGYLDRDDINLAELVPADRTNFLRWAAASSLSPFMQLHGRANLTPWSFPNDTDPEETADIYKYWATVHTDLIPYFYALSEEGFNDFTPILRPVGAPETWAGDYRYTLGEKMLVAPFLDGTHSRGVAFPVGEWWDFFTGERHSVQVTFNQPDLRRALVFLGEGAIVATRSRNEVSGLSTAEMRDALVLHITPGEGSFVLHEDPAPVAITVTGDADAMTVSVPARPENTWLRVFASNVDVQVDGNALTAAADHAGVDETHYYTEGAFTWVRLSSGAARSVTLSRRVN